MGNGLCLGAPAQTPSHGQSHRDALIRGQCARYPFIARKMAPEGVITVMEGQNRVPFNCARKVIYCIISGSVDNYQPAESSIRTLHAGRYVRKHIPATPCTVDIALRARLTGKHKDRNKRNRKSFENQGLPLRVGAAAGLILSAAFLYSATHPFSGWSVRQALSGFLLRPFLPAIPPEFGRKQKQGIIHYNISRSRAS